MGLGRWIGFGGVLAALAAGCGQAGTPSAKPPRHTAQAVPATAAPALPELDAKLEGDALLARLREAFDTCTGAEGEARSWSQGHYKAGAKVAELRKSTYRSRMLWAKPRKIKGEILETDNFLVGGAKMATLDGKKVRVRAAGVLGLFPLTLDAADDLLSSNRRHRFSDQTPDAICRRLLGPNARWVVVGGAKVAGADTRLIEVEGVTRLDNEITREVIAIDPDTPALRGVTMYAKGTKVVEVTFTRFRWNPKAKPSDFEL